MHFSVLSLFPEQVLGALQHSIMARALERKCFSLSCINIRDFADNPYGKIDDTLFGGGKGMLMQCAPIKAAWDDAVQKSPARTRRGLYMSPKGKTLTQALVQEFAQEEELVLLCGHYEGVDARIIEDLELEEVSIGDYVLSGGELAATIIIDAVARLLPGVLPAAEAFENESHSAGVLECRHYTKPAVWESYAVPEVLQSGHHAQIAHWRKYDGLSETLLKRPELFNQLQLHASEYEALLKHLESEFDIDVRNQSLQQPD